MSAFEISLFITLTSVAVFIGGTLAYYDIVVVSAVSTKKSLSLPLALAVKIYRRNNAVSSKKTVKRKGLLAQAHT